jgi:hypothetical protein
MAQMMFDVLFILALFVPPAVVLLGAAMLALPRTRHHTVSAAHPARA